MQIIKAILADDHRIFIEGLKCVLSKSEKYKFEIVGVAHDGNELIDVVRRNPADLLILELNLPETDGLEAMKVIEKEHIPIRILTLSMYNEPKIVKSALKAGAAAYILKDKDIDELFHAMNEVFSGQTYIGDGVAMSDHGNGRGDIGNQHTDLEVEDRFVKKYHLTKREMEILRLITKALSNKEIAKELFISDQTVSVHRKNIMRKLGVSNTAGLIKAAYDYSIV